MIMNKTAILETIRKHMTEGDGDVYSFVDWLTDFIDDELGQ